MLIIPYHYPKIGCKVNKSHINKQILIKRVKNSLISVTN